jgi:hypothetical protein
MTGVSDVGVAPIGLAISTSSFYSLNKFSKVAKKRLLFSQKGRKSKRF